MVKNTSTEYTFIKSQIDLVIHNIVSNKYNEELTYYDVIWLPNQLTNSNSKELWQLFQDNLEKLSFTAINTGLPNPNAAVDLVIVKMNSDELKPNAVKYFEVGKRKNYLTTQYPDIMHKDNDTLFHAWDNANHAYHSNEISVID
ncbi:hypothetical protein ACTL31_02140 [Leuconostoc mesenteroides]